jgi:TRAP-type C4-dicarboxylate transport system permease small subunit
MSFISKINKQVNSVSEILNWMSAASVVVMMLLTCLDVVLRLFRHPIPGTYEMVGFTGAILVSFSLAHTSLNRGHIAVDFLVSKLYPKAQSFVVIKNSVIFAGLFSRISWQSVIYALETKNAGEVSMTLQMPIFPFIFGIAAGCGILSIVLVLRFILSFSPDENIVR